MLNLNTVWKSYKTRHGEVHALREIDLQIGQGEFLVVRGPSGSGKTTLLLTLGGMLRPSKGQVVIGETDLYGIGVKERAVMRASQIGFVFQMFHLIPYLNVLDNTVLAVHNGNASKKQSAPELLNRLGLGDRLSHRPAELSAGEKQRTAIARAMINNPNLILADEPTGNLDPQNAQEVIQYLSEYRDQGGTVIVVTHGSVADEQADRIVTLENGTLVPQK